ncbi:hypothetical protein vseg_014082 [Gypsophila vaccaria]
MRGEGMTMMRGEKKKKEEEEEEEEEKREEEEGGGGPFRGLVICVTGICKEARKEVMQVTVRLGGIYSPNLHPHCTHLLVPTHSYSFPPGGGPKLRHAFLHASSTPLFVVSLHWFFDSVSSLSRLHESPYSLRLFSNSSIQMGDWLSNSESGHDSCFAARLKLLQNPSEDIGEKLYHSEWNCKVFKQSHLSGHAIYIDSKVSAELHSKVADVVALQGAIVVDQWFVGCGADYVVCEWSSIHKYLGHCDNIVSPIWFLKTSKERSKQRFVSMSADLARETVLMLESLQRSNVEQEANKEKCCEHTCTSNQSGVSQTERLKIVKLAKRGIRSRRARHLQLCSVPLRPINSGSLLESICWSISEPTSAAAVYEESLLSTNDCDIQTNILLTGLERVDSDMSFSNLLRPLTESERSELVFKNHFFTILFPVDRFSEMGPSSRTFFSDSGFTCLQLLNFVYDFYQENMSHDEIQAAIHTDSRHAELLRSVYCSERMGVGDMVYKRIQFLGSRKNFEMLKRVNGDNNSNVYELLIRE